jgi:tetratricopeptide (TPR) repeat protein
MLYRVPFAGPIFLLAFWVGMASAQVLPPESEADPEGLIPAPVIPDAPDDTPKAAREAELDALFGQLAEAGDPEWRPIQQRILASLARSESAAMTLLLARAGRAVENDDLDKALVFLDDLVRLAPDYAEAWNRRATVHFLRRDYGRSVADIRRVLALEPRHFGALGGLGIILDRLDRDAEALQVFRRALEIHPNLEGAQEAVERLAPEVDGREL